MDVSTTSTLVTWQFSQPGGRTVAVRYTDNDGQTGGIYEFQISVTNPRRYYYIKDHLGSIRTTVDEEGNVSGYDDYYPFGLVMPGRSSNTGIPNDDVKFTGYEWDDEADLTLYHAEARGYDPVIGRFMQVDPITNTRNPQELFNLHGGKHLWYSPYAYTFNNPVIFTDPDGRNPLNILLAIQLVKAKVTATSAGAVNAINNTARDIQSNPQTQQSIAKAQDIIGNTEVSGSVKVSAGVKLTNNISGDFGSAKIKGSTNLSGDNQSISGSFAGPALKAESGPLSIDLKSFSIDGSVSGPSGTSTAGPVSMSTDGTVSAGASTKGFVQIGVDISNNFKDLGEALFTPIKIMINSNQPTQVHAEPERQ